MDCGPRISADSEGAGLVGKEGAPVLIIASTEEQTDGAQSRSASASKRSEDDTRYPNSVTCMHPICSHIALHKQA